MIIFKDKKNLINEIASIKNIAFVPTMGSIHKGHLSLIKKAKKESKNVLVSIYVNPKQFNSNSDFKNYPRDTNKDVAILRKIKIKYLYLPSDSDIYSFRPMFPVYLDNFAKTLCGKFRPGHFKGVVNVVNRFIDIIKPQKIFLGSKDFQQLSLIKLHIAKNKIQTKIISCPTIRTRNGVALSSRNIKLSKNQNQKAAKIFYYLKNIKKNLISGNLSILKLKIIKKIISLGAEKIDYLELINIKTLKPAKRNTQNYNIFIAYYLGNVRIIDNL